MKSNPKIPNDSLVILVGVPGSGKSTLAKKIARNESEIISTDKIRGEINGNEADQGNAIQVFDEYHKRIEEKLKNGQLAIADATSIYSFARENLYALAQKYGRPVRVIIMNISLEECLKQNAARDRKVPEDVIIKMFEQLRIEYKKIDEEVAKLSDGKVYDMIRPQKVRYLDEKQIDLER